MCGITGIYAFNEIGRFNMINLSSATEQLAKRGPDNAGLYNDHFVGLGHRRLSIIDISDNANQPMQDETGRYVIVYNGEIYNYQSIRKELVAGGVTFQSTSDTEVLLKLYINEKEQCLNKLNGFFSFAVYDSLENSLFIARDRMGIKPMLYYLDEDKLLFASEMKSLLAYGVPRGMDYESLYQYLQLNYIPAPNSILHGIKKLMPGHYIKISKNQVKVNQYYHIPYNGSNDYFSFTYEQQQEKLKSLLEDSIQKRLVSDVPLGAFLSGGIDSSVITALASRHTNHLNTFSIGYKDEPYFDETSYARLVAKKLGTEHTIFSLSNHDLYTHLFDILDYLDEPFADSSAIPVYILSKHTRQTAKVALSGDGADELFSGYDKHMAAYKAIKGGVAVSLVKSMLPLWKVLPKSRSGRWSNKVRQLQRFAQGMQLDEKERYWRWASLSTEDEAIKLLSNKSLKSLSLDGQMQRKSDILKPLSHNGKSADINDILYTDVHLVLTNDMLTKVDMMSMANSLEVRVPFLDHEIVKFAFQLPTSSKINSKMKKRIVQDAFRDILPKELYNRPKHGFEVPLLNWFKNELRPVIETDLLADDFVAGQGIFNVEEVRKLKHKLFSNNPGDVHARIWALIVFQWWWKKYMK